MPVSVCMISAQPQYSFSVQAMSYGLGRDVSGQPAVQALKKIHEEGRFRLDTLTGFNMMMPYRIARLHRSMFSTITRHGNGSGAGLLYTSSSPMRERWHSRKALIKDPSGSG